MSNVEGAVLYRISSGVFRTGKKPPIAQRTPIPPPTLDHAVRSSALIFAQAAGVQGAISLGYALVMSVRSLKTLRAALSGSKLVEMVRTSSRFGAFVGVLNAAVQLMEFWFYRRSRALLRARLTPNAESTLRRRAAVKNGVTALLCAAALMVESAARRHTIALFLFPRALDVLTLVGLKKGLLPRVPFAPTILFTACQVVIITCWAKFPQYLDPAYDRLIYKWAGPGQDRKWMRDCVVNPAAATPVSCNVAHVHEGDCVPHLAQYFLTQWQMHSLMYVPLYLVPRLVMRWKSLLTDPAGFMGGYLQNVLTSGLFLACYTVFVKGTICVSKRVNSTNRVDVLTAMVAGAASGPSVLWERPSRRIELLLYVSQRAAESVWRGLCAAGWARNLPGWDAVMFFVVSFACLHAREYHRDCLRPLLKLMLTKVLGRSYLQQHMEAETEAAKQDAEALRWHEEQLAQEQQPGLITVPE